MINNKCEDCEKRREIALELGFTIDYRACPFECEKQAEESKEEIYPCDDCEEQYDCGDCDYRYKGE